MLGPMTPITEALRTRAIEEEAVRKQEEERRKELESGNKPDPHADPSWNE